MPHSAPRAGSSARRREAVADWFEHQTVQFPQTRDRVVGFGDGFRAAVLFIPAPVISGPVLKTFRMLVPPLCFVPPPFSQAGFNTLQQGAVLAPFPMGVPPVQQPASPRELLLLICTWG